MRLLIQQRIDGIVSLPRRRHGISLMSEHVFSGGELLPERRISRRQMPDHERLMRLRTARQHRRDERDADAAAEVAHEVVEAAGVADLGLANWLMVVVVSGTKIKLMAMPLMTLGQTTLDMPTCRLMSLNMSDDNASMEKPKHSIQRIRIFPTSRPTTRS